MKLRITFKDPDGVYDSLEDAGLDPNELPEDVEKVVKRFIDYGEYVYIDIDIANGTAEVVPV